MLKILSVIAVGFVLSGCFSMETKEKEPLKTPCVGIDGSPCERRPVNIWLG